jgi:NAD-dependent deacetylase
MISAQDQANLRDIAAKLAQARRLLFITGAGISAESGLPTYRGVGGLYSDSATEDGMPIEEALSAQMLAKRPALPWKYMSQIERSCRGRQPNRAHEVIAALEARGLDVWVLTQNVDGFHKQAGSRQVIDIHGDVHFLYCTRAGCGWKDEVQDYAHLGDALPPLCPECRALIRPDVVLFGESLPIEKMLRLREQRRRGFDAVFSVGTTSVFPYIAAPVWEAREEGVPTIEVNPGTTEVSGVVDHRIQASAAVALDMLFGLLYPA